MATEAVARSNDERQVHCWACRALIVVPLQDGVLAQIYKVRPRLLAVSLARGGRPITAEALRTCRSSSCHVGWRRAHHGGIVICTARRA